MNKKNQRKILILGARGLVGHELYNSLAGQPHLNCFGTVRGKNIGDKKFLHKSGTIVSVKDLRDCNELENLLAFVQPRTVINCLSTSDFRYASSETLSSLFVNVPKSLSRIAERISARVINISSDAVFSGKGDTSYDETCKPDATEPYGIAKIDGEVNAPHVLNLRTSFIGYDPFHKRGVLEWFLSQTSCHLYPHYIFSGLPAPKFAEILHDYVLGNEQLNGTFHVGSQPISKLDCLKQISNVVDHRVKIFKDESVVINRSLSTKKFASATGYQSQSWMEIRDHLCLKEKRY